MPMMSELTSRLRSRVLDVLALVADADAQRRYQARVPHVDVPAELFNQWDDSFFPASDDFGPRSQTRSGTRFGTSIPS